MSDIPDDEVDRICAGYKQNAAKVRFFERLGVRVARKPNGRPLVNRQNYDAVTTGAKTAQAGEPNWSKQ